MRFHRFDARSVGVGHGHGKVYLEFRDADTGELVFWTAMDPISGKGQRRIKMIRRPCEAFHVCRLLPHVSA